DRHLFGEPFESAHSNIIPLYDSAGMEDLLQKLYPGRSQSLRALTEHLYDEAVPVAIDDKRRDEVAFAMHEPVGINICHHAIAKGGGREKPRPPEVAVHIFVQISDHPQSYLGLRAVESPPKTLAF